MTPTFFTIITATYNAASTVADLLESLAGQTCRDFELVVQDGASTDDTVAVVESWRDRLPALSLVSEPDSGIYDAWNRALERIQGQWALFLGADDTLHAPDVLERVKAILIARRETAGEKTDLFAGGAIELVDLAGAPCGGRDYHPDSTVKQKWRGMPFPHQGLFHHCSVFAHDRFNVAFRICADYDFVCRLWTRENGNCILPMTVTRMRRGGISDRPESLLRREWENALASAKYFDQVWELPLFHRLAERAVIWLLCRALGRKRALAVLDFYRNLRGLQPFWRNHYQRLR